MSTYDFEPEPADYGPEPAHIANPSKRPWVSLTDDETKEQIKHSDLLDMFEHIGWYSAPRKGFDKNAIRLIQSIEAKLKEKNT